MKSAVQSTASLVKSKQKLIYGYPKLCNVLPGIIAEIERNKFCLLNGQ